MTKQKDLFHSIATLAYLTAAFFITAATSKSQPRGPGDPDIFNAQLPSTSYSAESNCPGSPNVRALHTKGGRVTSVHWANGETTYGEIPDFRHFGFPQTVVIVGLDQYSKDSSTPERCLVVERTRRPNPTYDATQTSFVFIEPGSLTRVTYNCTTPQAQCTTILEELPAAELTAQDATKQTADEL